MITYVINTSENKTFDSEKLFDLAGYNKIRWIQCSMSEIESCARTIYEKQNVLGADLFRIAVIVDFYSFDKIRPPYGRRGYGAETGVDMSLYMPYIEIYLLDNLIGFLERRDMLASDFEVYYVQNEKCDRYELLDSAEEQLSQIFSGKESEFAFSKTVTTERLEKKPIPPEGRPPLNELTERPEKIDYEKIVETVEEKYYRSFVLYCTENVSLEFKMADYPYGTDEMTFSQFFKATKQRSTAKNGVRRHYYISSYGGGASRAAFDTLSLSLYLIRMYEREEAGSPDGEMEVIHLEATVLRDVIEEAWSKVNAARDMAKFNNLEYYSLVQFRLDGFSEEDEPELTPKEAIRRERNALPKDVTRNNMSGDAYYKEICGFASRTAADVKNRNRKEFDRIMSEYLKKRDETRETNMDAEFKSMKEMGLLKMTTQTPSQNDYDHAVDQKQGEISALFGRILAAEYIEVNYEEEKKKADKAYSDYKKAKAWMHRNLIGDIIFMILSVLAMVLPYYLFQLTSYNSKVFSSLTLCLLASVIFGGLFVLSVVLRIIPYIRKMNTAKATLYNCYLDCNAKEIYSFSSIRDKYEKDLLKIEQARYELRQMKHLFEANQAKNNNVNVHRNTLEELEDCLAAMLNNLDVEPVLRPNESVEGEFDLSKPIRARENKVYKIFSIETIEKMFPKKGREEQ